jgi:hypothetical protein
LQHARIVFNDSDGPHGKQSLAFCVDLQERCS